MSILPRILFLADAGPRVGGGHVMRGLTLAQALEAQGAACTFLVTPPGKTLIQAFGGGTPFVETDDITLAELIECAAEVARDHDAVVIDHYGLSALDHLAIADGRPTLVIDDLADRPLAADLVLDSGPARQAEDYEDLVELETQLLLGPDYAPVRPAFPALRREALARRAGAAPVRRILVSLGLTDLDGITGRVVDLMLPITGDATLDVVLGSGAPSLHRLRGLAIHEPRLVLHVDSQDMPRLTLDADLAVGAGGSTSWERCVLALPTLLLVLAANQREASQALVEADAVVALDVADRAFDTAFVAELRRLLDDPLLRDRLSSASAAVCDGRGAARVAARFLALLRG